VTATFADDIESNLGVEVVPFDGPVPFEPVVGPWGDDPFGGRATESAREFRRLSTLYGLPAAAVALATALGVAPLWIPPKWDDNSQNPLFRPKTAPKKVPVRDRPTFFGLDPIHDIIKFVKEELAPSARRPKPIRIINDLDQRPRPGAIKEPQPQPAPKPDTKPQQKMPPKQVLQRGGRVARRPKQGGSNGLVRAPVAISVSQRAGRQSIRSQGQDLIVTSREYLRDIAGSTSDLSITSQIISPEDYPWAKSFSLLYESYVFESCKYMYVPMSSSANTGFVFLAPDYDPADSHTALAGKANYLAFKDAKGGQPWDRVLCTLTRADLQRQKTLFTGTAASSTDLRLHYAGNLFVGVGANTGTTNIGELWVEYTIRFKTKQLVAVKHMMADTGDIAEFIGSSNAAFFGTAASAGSIPAVMTSSGTTTSVTTWTFSAAWEGYIVVNITGTISSIAPSGTGTESEIWEDATSLQWFGKCSCDAGQTFILTIGNSAYTDATARFIRGKYTIS